MIFKPKKEKKDKLGVFDWVLFAVLVTYSLILLALLLFGLFSSVNTRTVYNHKIFFPDGKEWVWAFDNYVKVFSSFVIDNELLQDGTFGYANFYSMTVNSFAYAIGGAFVSVAAYFLAAYATSKFPNVFSKIVYNFVIVSMVIPIIGATPANVVILKSLGLFESMLSVYVMKFNFLGMYFLVFHAIFSSLSKDYAEAASLDGASEWTIMLKIMLPLVMPTVSTIFLIRFIECWNEYGFVLIYLRSFPTLSYGVYKMSLENVNGMDHATMRIASAFLVGIPVITLFILFRNKIMGNVTMGGVKE